MQNQQYHPIAKYLHWIIAALIVLQFILANLAEDAETPSAELAILANHKSVGITIFLLAVLRLAWRLRQGVPRALPMPEWQFIASRISHWSMYALILLLPITGWLTSSASAHSVSWFDLVPLPDLVAPDAKLEEKLADIHEIHAQLLFAIVMIHIAAAVRHALKREGALARITSPGPLIAFVVLIAIGSVTLTKTDRVAAQAAANGTSPRTTAIGSRATTDGPWGIDYDASHIRFTATQAGEKMNGEWLAWRGYLQFDEAHLDRALFDVIIDVASVETFDDERDAVLQGAEWFDSENHPEVRYYATRSIQNSDGRYRALGALTVKGRSVAVSLDFTLTRGAGKYVLDGTTQLDRLALDLGTGEWSDTRWIGRFVTVNVHVELRAAN